MKKSKEQNIAETLQKLKGLNLVNQEKENQTALNKVRAITGMNRTKATHLSQMKLGETMKPLFVNFNFGDTLGYSSKFV